MGFCFGANIYKAKIIDLSPDSMIFELTAILSKRCCANSVASGALSFDHP